MNEITEYKMLQILRAMDQHESRNVPIDSIRSLMPEPLEKDEIQDLLEIMEKRLGFVTTQTFLGVGGNGVGTAELTAEGRQHIREEEE